MDKITLDTMCVCDYCEDGIDSCYDETIAYWNDEMLETWLTANNAHNRSDVVVHGKGMTWLNVDGYAECEAQDVLNTLQIRGDYRIEIVLEDNKLSAKRWSHDEPTGCSFEVSFVPDNEE